MQKFHPLIDIWIELFFFIVKKILDLYYYLTIKK